MLFAGEKRFVLFVKSELLKVFPENKLDTTLIKLILTGYAFFYFYGLAEISSNLKLIYDFPYFLS